MKNSVYHATLKKMHDDHVDPDYSHGWASGVLKNPPLEEQRVTDAYTEGYEHGENGILDGYGSWIIKES